MARDEFYAAIGARIRAVRKAQKRGQKELAAKLDLSRESISNIEAGRHALQLHIAVRIADVLGVPLAELLPKSSTANDHALFDAREEFKTRVLRGSR
jgi:transcriptional regulator with XRE-family HTH domain